MVCPSCHGTLRCRAEAERGDEIVEGHLRCECCAATYAIRGGVPRMVVGARSAPLQRTAQTFGYEWTRFATVHDTYERQFLEWIAPLTPADFAERIILDAGCGMGRHMLLAAEYGADAVIGIDLSNAVDVAFSHTAHLPNAHVVQANIHRLPFRSPFDLVYSVGVLHHLPDPQAGFRALVDHIKPNGQVAAWVYGAEGNFLVTRLVNPLRETITSRMPFALVNAVSWAMAAVAYPWLKAVFLPIQRSPAWHRRLRMIPYVEYACYLSEFGLNQLHSIVFDHLSPPVSHYLRREDVLSWCTQAGLAEVDVVWHKRYSWRVRSIRPAAVRDLGSPSTSGGGSTAPPLAAARSAS